MNQFQLQAEIVRQEQVGPQIFRMTLRAPEIAATARAGQFVMVQVTEGRDPLLRRPFSIHQATGDGLMQLLFKVLGKGTAIMAAMTPGRAVNLVGPLGRGFDQTGEDAVCLVGGGMGMAPLYFLAGTLLRQARVPRLIVLLGARTANEVKQLSGDFQELGIEVNLATDDGSLGHHGSVVDLLSMRLATESKWSVCTCGPHPMMKAVASDCRQHGRRCQVSLETMMACGISACLGCAVMAADLSGPYLHVCKDGPVFDASEVAWL